MVNQQFKALLLWTLLCGAAGAVPDSSLTPAPPHAADDLLFASPTTVDHIGRVVVPVTINGKGPFRFIVDTGANHSTISPQLVQALKLETVAGPAGGNGRPHRPRAG